jgi:hypothetical protein
MENLILLCIFIMCWCGVFVIADMYIAHQDKKERAKYAKLNGFNYKL